ncbi:short-chain dehydrogenase [Candidatus Marinamargulisbacteria bacterium SCGC AAA071-K20]|nr:short-chain dehydrogenase [Candidatus Marinamargulisbacteria bacterium SCGC AAA071-K20]
MKDLNIRHKVVWITGASKGIGHALALLYQEKKWVVCCTSRSIQNSDFLDPKFIHLYPGDVSIKMDVNKIMKQILNDHKHIDHIIFNAGTHLSDSIYTFNSKDVKTLFDTNVMSIVYGFEFILKHLKDCPTTVGVMSSVVSYTGLPKASAYGATKAAIRNLTQSLQVELSSFPLHLSIICPGFVKTPLTDKNNFKMPFIISSKKAALIIYKGMVSKKLEIHFPLRMSLLLKFIASLPQQIMLKLLSLSIKS